MGYRAVFLALCSCMASAAFGQSVEPAPARKPEPRPVSRTEGRNILAAISTVEPDSDFGTDCSHLVHDVYERAGFSYDYASSRELYMGSINFTRVRKPQPGDLIVWQGHVGIVLDPKEHSFFSFVRSGPDTQFYDSPYWRSRGSARFFRYLAAKPALGGRTIEATRRTNDEPVVVDRRSENRPPSGLPRMTPASKPTGAAESSSLIPASSGLAEPPRGIVLQVAGKNPAPSEIVDGFVKLTRDSAASLRTHGISDRRRTIIVYGELRVSAVEVKGKHGSALVSVESLSTAVGPQASSQPRWRELSLEFDKTKSGWFMSSPQEGTYVSREAALQALSARLAELAQNTESTVEEEHEQKQIIRFLNLLVPDDNRATSAQSNQQ